MPQEPDFYISGSQGAAWISGVLILICLNIPMQKLLHHCNAEIHFEVNVYVTYT